MCRSSRASTLALVLGSACSLVTLAVACTDLTGPLPTGAIPWRPPARFALWWQMTESCSGTQGDLASIKWYVVPKVASFDMGGQRVQGETLGDDRILLVESHRLDGALVRHEMLHALLRTDNHPRTFLNACSDVVACEGQCEAEAGGRPTPPPDAPELTPRDVGTRVEVVPRQPVFSRDSGAFAVVVSITNPLGTPAWVRLTPQAPGDPFSHTFGVIIDGGGRFGDNTYIEGTRFPLGAYETRRFVWERALFPGRFDVRGWFNGDTTPPFILNVSP